MIVVAITGGIPTSSGATEKTATTWQLNQSALQESSLAQKQLILRLKIRWPWYDDSLIFKLTHLLSPNITLSRNQIRCVFGLQGKSNMRLYQQLLPTQSRRIRYPSSVPDQKRRAALDFHISSLNTKHLPSAIKWINHILRSDRYKRVMHDKMLSLACLHSRAVQLEYYKWNGKDLHALGYSDANARDEQYAELGLIEDLESDLDVPVNAQPATLGDRIERGRQNANQALASRDPTISTNGFQFSDDEMQMLKIMDDYITAPIKKWIKIRDQLVKDFEEQNRELTLRFGFPGDGPGALELEHAYLAQRGTCT